MQISQRILLTLIAACSPTLASAQEGQLRGSPNAARTTENTFDPQEQRIAHAKNAFNQQLAAFPDDEVSVTAFFKNPKSVEQAINEARSHGLRLQGFRHVLGESSGGYLLTPGESIEAAVEQYQADHVKFLEQQIAHMTQMLGNSKHQAEKASIAAKLNELENRRAVLSREGLQIIGIDVRGTARKLKQFAGANPSIHVLELRQDGRVQSPIRPE